MRAIRAITLVLLIGCVGCAGSSTAPDAAPPRPTEVLLAEALEQHRASHHAAAAALAAPLTAPETAPPQRETALFLLAECRFQLGEFEAAYPVFLTLAKDFPTSRAVALVPSRLYQIGKTWVEHPRVFLFGIQVDRSAGEDVLGHVAIDFPRSAWADDAWLELAEAHDADGDHDLAAIAYESLLRNHPRSEHRERASIGAAQEYQHMSRGPEYDAEPLLRARQAAVRYLKEYGPDGHFADRAIAMIGSLTEAVAASERAISNYYHQRGAHDGERLHDVNARRLLGMTDDEAQQPDSTELLRPRVDRPIWRAGGTLPPLLIDSANPAAPPRTPATGVRPAG